MVCLLSKGTVNELLCFHSFCFEDLLNCRNHPYDVSGERLTQCGFFFLKVKKHGKLPQENYRLCPVTKPLMPKVLGKKGIEISNLLDDFSLAFKGMREYAGYFLPQIGFCRFGPIFLH